MRGAGRVHGDPGANAGNNRRTSTKNAKPAIRHSLTRLPTTRGNQPAFAILQRQLPSLRCGPPPRLPLPAPSSDLEAFEADAHPGMQMRFNVWVGNPQDFGGNFSPSSLPVYQYINWVAYSEYAPGEGHDGTDFALLWREDFDGPQNGEWASGNEPDGLLDTRRGRGRPAARRPDGVATGGRPVDVGLGYLRFGQPVPPPGVHRHHYLNEAHVEVRDVPVHRRGVRLFTGASCGFP